MPNDYPGSERREFLRYAHERPAAFKELPARDKAVSEMVKAFTKNLSASGLLFTSRRPPRLSSIIALDVDYRTSRLCEEIEERALVSGNRLIGKVVRIEDNGNGSYDIGVAFIKKSETGIKDLTSLC